MRSLYEVARVIAFEVFSRVELFCGSPDLWFATVLKRGFRFTPCGDVVILLISIDTLSL